MNSLDSLLAAKAAIADYAMMAAGTLPETTRGQLRDILSRFASPVTLTIMDTLEALYAAKSDLDDAGRTLVAQLATFAVGMGWNGINDDARGERIVAAMRRDLGEKAPSKAGWPAPDADPAPDARFVSVVMVAEASGDVGNAPAGGDAPAVATA